MLYLILLPVFFALMLCYFKIAEHYNIIDKPNDRSSHTEVTIRGGGVIFVIAGILAVILHTEYWLPGVGLFLIGTISFIDDRITLSSKIRILIHVFAVTLMFIFLNVFDMPFYWAIAFYIIAIGVINMYNFMDGINGITGTYTLVVLAGLQYVNLYEFSFVEPDLIWLPIIACIVFLYFNFRKRAKCFAGDVGSVSIAFWLVLLIFKLCFATNNWTYILFLSVYGIDSVLTISHRLILKQNIFNAHRMHLYQILANEYKIPHLIISIIYGLIQALIIVFLISNNKFSPLLLSVIIVTLAILYIIVRYSLMARFKKSDA